MNATSEAYRVGAIEIVVVSDGERTAPVAEGFVLNAPLDEVQRAYTAYGVSDGHGNTPFNPTVIHTAGQTVLVDTGVGSGTAAQPGATAGFLLQNLAAIGIGPDDIGTVIVSHFHGDHVNGLLAPDGSPAFPRAAITVPANEWCFWMDDGELARATPGRMQDLFANNRRVFEPLADRVRTHAWDEEVVPGVTAVGTPGSLEHPGWHLAFDQDPVEAEATRRRTLDWLAREQLPVQGFHFPFPGRALVAAVGDAYRAVPTRGAG